jgi:hypothetical protein
MKTLLCIVGIYALACGFGFVWFLIESHKAPYDPPEDFTQSA